MADETSTAAAPTGRTGLRRRPAFLTVNSTTGAVMGSAGNPRTAVAPASLTKLMTTYELFDALRTGRASWEDRIPITQHSMQQTGRHGGRLITSGRDDSLSMEEALGAMLVRSANDAAIAVGKYVARLDNPTLSDAAADAAFVARMNARAQQLGMRSTSFVDASGLPRGEDRNRRDTVSTACDMATLGLAMRHHFPEQPFRDALQRRAFSFRNFWEREKGTSLDGMQHQTMTIAVQKTGYVQTGGFNAVAEATRDNAHVVAVHLGGKTADSRDNAMLQQLGEAFRDRAPRAWRSVCGDTGGLTPPPPPASPTATASRAAAPLATESVTAVAPPAPTPAPPPQTPEEIER